MKKFKIATLALSACMALGVVGFTACGQAGKSAYDIWLEQGNTGTAQDFLDSLKGAAGTPGTPGNPGTPGTEGKSAYQVWLDAGNTGTEQDFLNSLKGADGTPGINGTNGTAGKDGTNGKDGATWHYGEGEPDEFLGNEGDLYLNYTTWDVYAKEEDTGWEKLGNLKGESEEPSNEVLVKNFGEITLGASETTELDLNNVSAGTYYLVAETDSAAKANTLYLKDPISHDGTSEKYNYDMYSPANGGEYRCVVYLKTDGTSSTGGLLTNKSGEEIKFKNVRLIEFDLVIEAGKEIVVPGFWNGWTGVTVPLSKDLVGKTVKLTVWSDESFPGLGPKICPLKNSQSPFTWSAENQVETGVWVKTYELSKSEEFIKFSGHDAGPEMTGQHSNVKIKFEIVEA